jgi:hypothetical protein
MNHIDYLSEPYYFYVDFITNSVFSQEEQAQYNQIANEYNNCFNLSKQNKLSEAYIVYAESCTTDKIITPHLAQWITAFCSPYISYYFYKKKNYTDAIELTNGTINTLQKLQEQGYQYLFFSEIQQIHNLGRISFAMGEIDHAISLSVTCLKRMDKQAQSQRVETFINGVKEKELIRVTQYGMIIQVLTETCSRLLKYFKADANEMGFWLRKLLNPLTKINFCSMSSDDRYKSIDNFVMLMNKILENGMDAFEETDLLLIREPNKDKVLLRTLYNYITIINDDMQVAV